MKIFITGGTGFIGKHVVEKLKENNELLLLVRGDNKIKNSDNIKIIKGDLSNILDWKEKVINFKPNAAIHLAWEGIPNYGAENSLKNLNYGINLIKMLTETSCKHIIVTGSCWEYGKDNGQLKENMLATPLNSFSTAKNTLNILSREIAEKNNIKFTWVRLFYVYGPGQREASLIPYLIKSIKKNKPPEIKTPDSKNDFIYIEDIAKAILSILKTPKEGDYNMGFGKSTSVRDVIREICNYYNFDYDPEAKKITKNIDFWADMSKMKEHFKWEPKTTIEEGIKKTINFHEKFYKSE